MKNVYFFSRFFNSIVIGLTKEMFLLKPRKKHLILKKLKNNLILSKFRLFVQKTISD